MYATFTVASVLVRAGIPFFFSLPACMHWIVFWKFITILACCCTCVQAWALCCSEAVVRWHSVLRRYVEHVRSLWTTTNYADSRDIAHLQLAANGWQQTAFLSSPGKDRMRALLSAPTSPLSVSPGSWMVWHGGSACLQHHLATSPYRSGAFCALVTSSQSYF